MDGEYILRDNLLIALYLAIETQENKEKAAGWGPNNESAMLSAWRSNFAALQQNALKIKY